MPTKGTHVKADFQIHTNVLLVSGEILLNPLYHITSKVSLLQAHPQNIGPPQPLQTVLAHPPVWSTTMKQTGSNTPPPPCSHPNTTSAQPHYNTTTPRQKNTRPVLSTFDIIP